MKMRVVAGPYRLAKRYAESQGWDSYVIVTRGHQLAALDPELIEDIVFMRARELGDRIFKEIVHEFHKIRALWPMPYCDVA